MTILLDFESRSRCDLTRRGGRNYWEHPSTEALCCVWHDTDNDTTDVWLPGDAPPWWADTDVPVAAHNMTGFDRFALARLGWRPLSAPWIDTSEWARRAGLPGALDALGSRWLGRPKDKVASKFVKSLSRASRAKARLGQLPELTADVMCRVVAYCQSDVEILEHGWPLLESWGEWEPDVERVDRAINDRGVCFDSALAVRLLECDARNGDRATAKAARALGMTAAEAREIAGSPQQFAAFTGAPNAQAETVDALIDDEPPESEAHQMALVRRAIASIARGKLEAGLARVSPDGRLRDMHRIYGAHPWRWSGRGMQLQNIPRPAGRFDGWTDADVCGLAELVLAGAHWPDAEEIDVLLRATLHAAPGCTLVVEDFSGVENRALSLVSGDQGALDVFASGVSPYKIMAGVIFGCDPDTISKGNPWYTVGKIAELACQYGMGGPKFEWTAKKQGGVVLSDVGVDPFKVVYAWRDQHAPMVRFWRDVEQAFACAVRGEEAWVDRFAFVPQDSGVAIFMPSGRPIVYNETRITHDGRGRPQLAFRGTKNVVEYTYGGKLTQNMIEGICRDMLADALVRAEDAGLAPVVHVHDEIVCEVPASAVREASAELHAIMTTLPEWVSDFPIGAAGHTGVRYRK